MSEPFPDVRDRGPLVIALAIPAAIALELAFPDDSILFAAMLLTVAIAIIGWRR